MILQKAITRDEPEEFIPVDDWEPTEEEMIFKHVKGAIILPVSKFYKVEENSFLDYFILSAKRCYNGEKIRNHCCKYLNYFERFYDRDKELLMVYYHIKYIIDCMDDRVYTDEAFLFDLKKYILDSTIFLKAKLMNEDNYILNLDQKRSNVDKIKTPSLQYTDKHGKILMEISLLMNMFIPLLVHYMSKRQIFQVKDFLLRAFDMIFVKYEDEVDVYSKLYETSISSINKNADTHSVLWSMQNIRGKNTTTHSVSAVNDIILQIMPKYNYNENIVSFNYMSIQWNIGFQVTGISYEYSFVSLSSSKRDEDNNSEFD